MPAHAPPITHTTVSTRPVARTDLDTQDTHHTRDTRDTPGTATMPHLSAPESRPPLDCGLDRDLDRRLAAARPRLARIAHLRGVPADAVEDVVQQTLLEAWRGLTQQRDADRFDAWLDGICRHMCQRYHRAVGPTTDVPLSALTSDESGSLDLTDTDALDLDDVLVAEDRARLLDRALGHLPAATRGAVEACYLADLPSGEAALRLGLTVNALEVRLHRARTQLRQLLYGPLREEAASLGLLLSAEESEGWRESREWCVFCGTRRLRGLLEPQPDGSTSLRLRCPECSPTYETDIESSGGLAELNGLSSIKPALRRYRAQCEMSFGELRASEWRHCPRCGGEAHLRIARPGDPHCVGERWYAMVECERCEVSRAWWAGMAIFSVSDVAATAMRWLDDHPRSRLEPDVLTTYDGLPALSSRIVDVPTGRATTIFSAVDTPRVLAIDEE